MPASRRPTELRLGTFRMSGVEPRLPAPSCSVNDSLAVGGESSPGDITVTEGELANQRGEGS